MTEKEIITPGNIREVSSFELIGFLANILDENLIKSEEKQTNLVALIVLELNSREKDDLSKHFIREYRSLDMENKVLRAIQGAKDTLKYAAGYHEKYYQLPSWARKNPNLWLAIVATAFFAVGYVKGCVSERQENCRTTTPSSTKIQYLKYQY